MAAWTATIDAVADDGNGGVQVSVTYWLATDTTFTNKLGGATHTFTSSNTLAEVQSWFIQTGKSIRFGQTASAALQAQVGQTIAVP